jgi:hypothetical protein
LIKVVAVSLLISCLLGQNVNATTYHVGTSGQTDYATLDVLRNNVTVWYDGDEIIFYNDDSSLAGMFNFGSKRITIGGNATISPSANGVRFSSSLNPVLLTIADGSSIVFDKFTTYENYSGGNVINNRASLKNHFLRGHCQFHLSCFFVSLPFPPRTQTHMSQFSFLILKSNLIRFINSTIFFVVLRP